MLSASEPCRLLRQVSHHREEESEPLSGAVAAHKKRAEPVTYATLVPRSIWMMLGSCRYELPTKLNLSTKLAWGCLTRGTARHSVSKPRSIPEIYHEEYLALPHGLLVVAAEEPMVAPKARYPAWGILPKHQPGKKGRRQAMHLWVAHSDPDSASPSWSGYWNDPKPLW